MKTMEGTMTSVNIDDLQQLIEKTVQNIISSSAKENSIPPKYLFPSPVNTYQGGPQLSVSSISTSATSVRVELAKRKLEELEEEYKSNYEYFYGEASKIRLSVENLTNWKNSLNVSSFVNDIPDGKQKTSILRIR